MEALTEETDLSESYSLEKIGGHNIVSCKPIFARDSKYLFVVCANHLRQYIIENGYFLRIIPIGHKNDIISIELNQNDSNELITAAGDGIIIVWNIQEDKRIAKIELKVKANVETILHFRTVFDTFYYTIRNVKDNVQLLWSHIDKPKAKMYVNESDHVNRAPNSISFGPVSEPKYCVAIHENNLYIYELPAHNKSRKIRHKIGDKQFTCVSCHPYDDIIATGDDNGCIILWQNDFLHNNHPTKTLMHWHQLPVADLCFSTEGSYIYSVGAEMVLVRWNISANKFGDKNFLSRIGMPMKFVACDNSYEYLATIHEDNSIIIINAQMDSIKTTIEGLCSAIGTKDKTKEYRPSGLLLWNKKMQCLVLSGRTGHLQFYDPNLQKQLFQLDIANQNIVSAARDAVIYPIEITNAAVSGDGQWFVTVEMRDDNETMIEMRLKFWNNVKKTYNLNTTIHLPHQSRINSLEFAPKRSYAVSTSDDRCFKIWHLIEDKGCYKKSWICGRIGSFNNVSIPMIAKFSYDSSILAVHYSNIITLWDVSDENCVTLKETLTSNDSELIANFIEFGYDHYSHYLIESNNEIIMIWNLLTLNVEWSFKPDTEIESIAVSPSNLIALFTHSYLYFFKINSNHCIRKVQIKHKNNAKIIGSLFVNNTKIFSNNLSECDIFPNYSLYCLTDSFELFSFVSKTGTTNVVISEIVEPPNMFFEILKKKDDTIDDPHDKQFVSSQMNADSIVNEMFLKVPSHVLPSMNILAKNFLGSLMKCQEISMKIEKKNKIEKLDNKEMIETDASEIDSQQNESANKTDIEMVNLNEDYSWLKECLKMK